MRNVGDLLTTHAQFHELPTGAVVVNRSNARDRWTKRDDGFWWSDAGNRSSIDGGRALNTSVCRVESLPPTVGQVGHHPANQAEYEALPVGTVVRGRNEWTKRDDGFWYRSSDGRRAERRTYLTSATARITFLPVSTVETSPFPVGHPLQSVEEFDQLLIGTIVGPNEDERYRKRADGWWRVSNTTNEDQSLQVDAPERGFSMGGYNRVLSLPEPAGHPTTFESVNQFMWKFRQHTIAAAANHLGDPRMATRVLDRLGITGDNFPIGTGVPIANDYDRDQLPEGTVIYKGNPKQVRSFGAFVKRGDHWRHLLGDAIHLASADQTFVDTLAGAVVEVDWNKPAAEPDVDAINRFKGLAWREGYREKTSQSWCSTFESVMSRIGIDASYERHLLVTSDGLRCGSPVTVEQVRALPVGSVVKWADPEGERWVYFMRTEAATNRAGTRRIFGYSPEGVPTPSGHYSSTGMMLEWCPDFGDMRVTMPRVTDLFEKMPLGTRWFQAGTNYVLCEDRLGLPWDLRTAIPTAGRHQQSAFNQPLIVTFFQVPS